MSYIRCLSNPERLYIWGEGGNRLCVSIGTEEMKVLPLRSFERLLKKWVKQEEDWEDNPIVFRDLKLEERPDTQFKWRLSYKNEPIVDMYYCTLYYLAHSNKNRL